MKKLCLAVLVGCSFFIFSCQHETPNPLDPGPTDTTASNKTLLAKTTFTAIDGVTTMTYRYDSENRLVWCSNTSTKAGYFEDTSRVVRDAQGIIKQIVYSSDTSRKFPDPKLDSVVFTVFYNGTQYTHKILQYKSFKVPFKDSTAYAYDAQGRINSESSYYFDYTTTKTYLLFAKTDYTYDAAANLTAANTIYYKVTPTTDYPFQLAYTYDAKGVNLLNLGNEAIVIGLQQNNYSGRQQNNFSGRLPATLASTYPQDPQYNHSYAYKYTFNTKYRPLKADITDAANNNAKSSMAFTYQ